MAAVVIATRSTRTVMFVLSIKHFEQQLGKLSKAAIHFNTSTSGIKYGSNLTKVTTITPLIHTANNYQV